MPRTFKRRRSRSYLRKPIAKRRRVVRQLGRTKYRKYGRYGKRRYGSRKVAVPWIAMPFGKNTVLLKVKNTIYEELGVQACGDCCGFRITAPGAAFSFQAGGGPTTYMNATVWNNPGVFLAYNTGVSPVSVFGTDWIAEMFGQYTAEYVDLDCTFEPDAGLGGINTNNLLFWYGTNVTQNQIAFAAGDSAESIPQVPGVKTRLLKYGLVNGVKSFRPFKFRIKRSLAKESSGLSRKDPVNWGGLTSGTGFASSDPNNPAYLFLGLAATDGGNIYTGLGSVTVGRLTIVATYYVRYREHKLPFYS